MYNLQQNNMNQTSSPSTQKNEGIASEEYPLSSNSIVFSEEQGFIAGLAVEPERFKPTEKEVTEIEKTIEDFLKSHKNRTRPLEEYKVQFLGFISEKQERIVWANFFCDEFGGNWKKDLILVKDGGNCFFNLKVNSDTKEVLDFYVNGEA